MGNPDEPITGERIPSASLAQLGLRKKDAGRKELEGDLKDYVMGTREDVAGIVVVPESVAEPGVVAEVQKVQEKSEAIVALQAQAIEVRPATSVILKPESPYIIIPEGELDQQARSFIEQRFN